MGWFLSDLSPGLQVKRAFPPSAEGQTDTHTAPWRPPRGLALQAMRSGWALVSHDVPPAFLGPQVPPGGNKTQYEEIGIPVALLSYRDMLDIFKVGSAASSSLQLVRGRESVVGRGPRSEAAHRGLAGVWFLSPPGQAVPPSGGDGEPAPEVRAPRLPGQAGRPCLRPALSDQRPVFTHGLGSQFRGRQLPDTSRRGIFSVCGSVYTFPS